MRKYYMMFGVLLCIQPAPSNAMSLQEAMAIASQQHPRLSVAKIQIDRAQANLIEQKSYAYNPEFSIEPQRRSLKGGGSTNDYYLNLSQGIELAGKQGYRKTSAQAALKITEQELDVQRQAIVFDVARAYINVDFSKRELQWRKQQLATFIQLKKQLIRKMELGDANQLDINLANASVIQAVHAESQVQQSHELASSNLMLAMGNTSKQQNKTTELSRLSSDRLNLNDPLKVALTSRPDIKRMQQVLSLYAAQADLAKAQRSPDLTLGISTGREAGDQVYSLSLSMPIPVFNTHDGAYRAALSQALAISSELKWLKQRVELEVATSQNGYNIAMQALNAMKQKNMPVITQMKLARSAFDAGELDIEELVIHMNQMIESRINAETIKKQGWLALIRLAEVLGQPKYIFLGMNK